MSYLQDSYSDNDYNQYSYLNQKIVQYISNQMYGAAWKRGSSVAEIKENLNIIQNTDISSFGDKATPFYINTPITTSPSVAISYNSVNTKTVIPTYLADPATTLAEIGAVLDRNYRFCLVTPVPSADGTMVPTTNLVTNLSYDISYLTDSTSMANFYPNNVNFHKIAPKIYLELCTTSINDFFAQLFTEIDSGIPKKVGKTIDSINTFCIPSNTSDNKVADACAYDKSNDRCACQVCYSGHSSENRQIADTMIKSKVSTDDPWCLYPKCASGKAFKNRIMQNRSSCSNISVSGIFLNPSEYSNIEISNTQVSASSANGNGINLKGGMCQDCADGQSCVLKGNTMTCSDTSETQKGLNISNDDGKGIHWSFILFIIFLTITLVLFGLYSAYKIPVIKFGLFLSIFMVLFSLMFYIAHKTKRESYTPFLDTKCINDVCYSNNDCGVMSCIGNSCQCPYGMFYDNDKCVDFLGGDSPVNNIVTSIPYLPHMLFAGVYFYTTVIGGIIYAFSTGANFKYDGEKWVELNRFQNQVGFHPDKPYIPYDETSSLFLNTQMCCTVGTSVVFMLGKQTLVQKIVQGESQLSYIYMIYDTLTDKWAGFIPGSNNPNTNNNLQDSGYQGIISVLKNSQMYVFGYLVNNVIAINVTTNTIDVLQTTNAVFSKDACAFIYNDKIYIGGMYLNNDPIQGYNIYLYDETSTSPTISPFTFVQTISPDFFTGYSPNGGQTGGVLPFFRKEDGTFFVLYNNTVAYYNIDTKKMSASGKVTGVTDTSIFMSTPIATPFYLNYSAGNCTFLVNGYVFIITGSGEIFRGFFDDTDETIINIELSPCYGVSNYDRPIDKKLLQT
jgi:hypothetical protein